MLQYVNQCCFSTLYCSERRSQHNQGVSVGRESEELDGLKATTMASGLNSIGNSRLKESDGPALENRLISCGNEQIDMSLMQHLLYCDSLLEVSS